MDRPLKVLRLAIAGLIALLLALVALGLSGPPALAKASKPPKGAVKVKPANVVLIARGVWCAKSPGNWKSYVPGKRLLVGKAKRKKTYFISALQLAKQARSAGQAKRFEKTHRRYLKKCQKIKPLRFNIKKAIGLARGKKKPRSPGRVVAPESNLQTILPSGVLRDAVVSGGINVQGYWFAPSGNVFLSIEAVDLNNATYLPETGGCAFIEVDRASGIPSCVDPEVTGIVTAAYSFGEEVQFDSAGNIYYAAWVGNSAETARPVLRRRASDGTVSQLFEGVDLLGYQLLPDDSVLAMGFEFCRPPRICSSASAWLKRFTPPPSASEETLLTTPSSPTPQQLLNGLSLFPDGNVYFYSAEPGPNIYPTNQRILRYLTREGRLDPKPWMRIGPELPSTWALQSLCTAEATLESLWPCAQGNPLNPQASEQKLYWGNIVTTPTGEVFVAALKSFYQAYPESSIIRTNYTLPFVGSTSAKFCISSTKEIVIYCGGDETGYKTDTIVKLDFATGSEQTLLSPGSGLAPYQVGLVSSGGVVIFAARRGEEKVMGRIDLKTNEVTILKTLEYDLIDFLIFDGGGAV